MPTITTPEPVIEATDADNTGFEAVTLQVRATDNVGIASVSCLAGAVAVSPAGVSGDAYLFTGSFPVGTTAVTCTALDVRGTPAPNSASVGFAVNVKDVTPPSFDLVDGEVPGSPFGPGNPAEATGAGGAVVTYTNPSATDSNGGPVTVVCASPGGLVSGSTFPIGVTDINCVATDVSGAATPPTNLFDITVADTTPPTVVVAGASTVTIEAGSAYVDAGASATDLVSGVLAPTTSGDGQPVGAGQLHHHLFGDRRVRKHRDRDTGRDRDRQDGAGLRCGRQRDRRSHQRRRRDRELRLAVGYRCGRREPGGHVRAAAGIALPARGLDGVLHRDRRLGQHGHDQLHGHGARYGGADADRARPTSPAFPPRARPAPS